MRAMLSSLRGRLLLVVALVLLPIAALIVHTSLEQRRRAVRDVEHQAGALARALADEQQRRVFNRAHQFLRVIAALPEVTGRDAARCSALLGELAHLDRRYVDLGAATAIGNVFCSAARVTAGRNIADRSFFTGAIESHGFSAGEYQTDVTGLKDTLVLAHAALDRDGRVQGVVFAELNLSTLDLGTPVAAVPDGSFAALIDRSAHVLARYPTSYAALGATIGDHPLLETVFRRSEGVVESSADGVTRLFGFAPVRALNGVTYGYVLVGIPRSIADAEPDRALVRNLVALALVGLIALGLAWVCGDLLLLRGVRALATASRRVMAGETDAETHLPRTGGELGQLARTVAGMAEAVRSQARAAEEADAARRMSEQALETEHAFVAAVLDIVGALVVVLDRDGRIVRFNRACEATTGYTFAEVRGLPFWNLFVNPARVESAKAVFEAIRTHRAPAYRESVVLTKDRQRRTIAWASTAVRDREGRTELILATGVDISERKRAEDALRRSEATARAFLESAAEAVLIADPTGRLTIVNTQAEQLFGYSRDELLGQPVELLIPERLRERHREHRSRYLADPKIVPIGSRLTLVGRRRDGTEFPAEISLSFIDTEDGLRVMAFIVDITERVAMQQRARQTEKLAALGTLAAGIAHEVNNPVGIITARTQLMLDDPALTPEQTTDLEVVLRQARRVGKIITGLLSFARRSPGTREPVDVNAIIDDTLALVGEPMRKSRVAVTLRLDPALPSVVGDPTAIQQVILNLLTNAREAMTDGGELRVATGVVGPDAGRVRVTVSDTGPGMPPEVVGKIFEPFFSTKAHGTGLGLAVSYGIVRDHHGTIDVESRPAEGTTFVLTFPVATEPPSDVPASDGWRVAPETMAAAPGRAAGTPPSVATPVSPR
jgi:PAS domain S-box-containing protein